MPLYVSKKAVRAAIWREDVVPYLKQLRDIFLSAFVRGVGYAVALLVLVHALRLIAQT